MFVSVKGHLRKGAALMGMRDPGRAQRAYQTALTLDPNNEVLFLNNNAR